MRACKAPRPRPAMVTPVPEMDVQQEHTNGERPSLAQKKKLKQKQRKAARRVERWA